MKIIIGKKFGNWTVIAFSRSEGKRNFYIIECMCGKRKERAEAKLSASNSCGCQNKTECAKRPKAEARDSGKIPGPPEWKPDFANITRTVKRVAAPPLWLIVSGSQIMDRQLMNQAERKRYAKV